MPERCDILIVGGGIGGAVLAERLARAGRHVIVIERSLNPAGGGVGSIARPELLWPASRCVLAELLDQRTLEREVSMQLEGIRLHDGSRWIELAGAEAFSHAGLHPYATEPARTRAAILSQRTFELRLGTEFKSLTRGQNGDVNGAVIRDVATHEYVTIGAGLIVGDDGTHSRVREQCGITIRLRPFPLDFLCGAVRWPASFPPHEAFIWSNLSGDRSGIAGAAVVPFPTGGGAALLLARPWVFDDPRRLHESVERFRSSPSGLADVIDAKFVDNAVKVRREWGHADHYGVPGALLIGDAAHPVSPAGGQGANMAIADAVAASEEILDGECEIATRVEQRRKRPNDRSLDFSRGVSRLLSRPRWMRPPALMKLALRFAESSPSTVGAVVRFAATAFQS